MNDEARKDSPEFDSLLDHAMAIYAAADPRPGLETRILSAVAREYTAPRSNAKVFRPWRIAAIFILAAATLILGLWMHTPHGSLPPQVAHQESSDRTTTIPGPLASARIPPVRASLRRPHKAQTILTKTQREATTPTLRAEEVLLAQLIRNGSAADLNPLDPKPIDIQPLNNPSLTTLPIRIEPIQIAAIEQLPIPAK